jgi:hypothetical protein
MRTLLALTFLLGVPIVSLAQSAPSAETVIKFNEAARLWDNLPKPAESTRPLPAAQGARYTLYHTLVSPVDSDSGRLFIDEPFCLYRSQLPSIGFNPVRGIQHTLETVRSRRPRIYACPSRESGHHAIGYAAERTSLKEMQTGDLDQDFFPFDILVDHLHETQPSDPVYTPPPAKFPVPKWYTYSLPMTDPTHFKFRRELCVGACFYRASVRLDAPRALSLDTSRLANGLLWVNGHDAGSFGSVQLHAIPAAWLKPGDNEVIVFDMDGDPFATITAR